MEQLNDSEGHGIYIETHCTTLKYTLKWLIENYSEILTTWHRKSPEFSVEEGSVWYVEFTKTPTNFVFQITRKYGIVNTTIILKFTVNDSAGKECYMTEKNFFARSSQFSYNIAEKNDSWLDTMDLMNTAKNDTLIFVLLIEIYPILPEVVTQFKIEKNITDKDLQQKLHQTLVDDLKKILDSHIQPDLVLRVQEQKIDAHRAILCTRSIVFQKMLQQEGMSETKLNIVDIEDVPMPVLKELVSFLYAGQLKDYDFQTALNLYYAADKYEVLELREVCARVLVSKLTLDDAPKVLSLAEMHQDTELKDKLMQFIKINYKLQNIST